MLWIVIGLSRSQRSLRLAAAVNDYETVPVLFLVYLASFQIAIMTGFFMNTAKGGLQVPARQNANAMMVKSTVPLSSVQSLAATIRSRNAGNVAPSVQPKKVRWGFTVLSKTSEVSRALLSVTED